MRRGFTIPEVLVAALLMLTVFALTMQLWISSSRGVGKGEDALAAVQDASLVLLNLRKDLQRLTYPPEKLPWQLRYIRIRGQAMVMNEITWDPAGRGFLNKKSESDSVGDVFKEDKTELSFYIFQDGGTQVKKVTYAYLPEQKSMRRQVGLARPHMFALPRLQDFQLQMHFASPEGLSRALFGADTPATGKVDQLWFSTRFVVQSEQDAARIQTTRVDMETRIFPRYVNRLLHTRWLEAP